MHEYGSMTFEDLQTAAFGEHEAWPKEEQIVANKLHCPAVPEHEQLYETEGVRSDPVVAAVMLEV